MKTTKAKDCSYSTEELKVHPALKEFFGYCFYKAALRLRALHTEALSQHGLIPPHMGILYILKKSDDGMNQITLGDELGIDKATMVKLIDQLEALKLVERTPHPEDRRVKLIKLTKKGSEKQEALHKIARQNEKVFLAALSEDERNSIRGIVCKLVRS
ncbi:Transcriptional regulator SlyA [compost metagenome]